MDNENAISLLKLQKEKINKLDSTNHNAWKAQSSSYIKEIFGEDSVEYKFISDFNFTIVYGDDYSYIWHKDTVLPNLTSFLDGCIEKIHHLGISKKLEPAPSKIPLYRKYDKSITLGILTFLLGIAYTAGHIVGYHASNYDLREEIRNLKDSLRAGGLVPPNDIPKREPASDTTTKQDENDYSQSAKN